MKAFAYAWEKLHLRGTSDSEVAHPMWNSFKKSVTHSNLTGALMKLTMVCSSIELENADLCFLALGFQTSMKTKIQRI